MKRFIVSIMMPALLIIAFGLQAQQTTKKDSSKMKMSRPDNGPQAGDLPYPVTYSSNFRLDKRSNAKMVLELYKDYEQNDFSTKQNWFSDTVTVFLADGSMFQGKEKVINSFKQNRQGFANTSFIFHAVIPLTSVDRHEDWVAIWGTQNFTTADAASTKGSEEFQAIWKISKDKKVEFVRLFSAKSPPQNQQ